MKLLNQLHHLGIQPRDNDLYSRIVNKNTFREKLPRNSYLLWETNVQNVSKACYFYGWYFVFPHLCKRLLQIITFLFSSTFVVYCNIFAHIFGTGFMNYNQPMLLKVANCIYFREILNFDTYTALQTYPSCAFHILLPYTIFVLFIRLVYCFSFHFICGNL